MGLKLNFFFLALVVQCVYGILDGDLAQISDYPFVASIHDNNIHRCGGTIVGVRYILTAASCIQTYNITQMTVRVGSTFQNEGGQLITVSSVIEHPDFNVPKTLLNNIAFLELNEDIKFDDNAQIANINMNASFQIPADANGTIVGWGIINRQESGLVRPYRPSEQLRSTIQPKTLDLLCGRNFLDGWNQENMFCAGIYRKDNCVGDAGNPFIYNGVVMGIASQTLPMCGQFSTAYSSTGSYSSFVSSFMDNYNNMMNHR